MPISHWRTSAIVSLAALVVCSGVAQAQTELRWKFQQGQKLKQSITQEMKMSANVGGQAIDTAVTQVISADWAVDKVDANGNAQVTQTISRIQMSMKGAMGIGFEIDSNDDAAPQGIGALIAPAIKAMAKSNVIMTMSPRGEILEAKLSKETEEALKALPGAANMGQMFNKDTLANMVKQGAPPLPEKAVKTGDSWAHAMEVEVPQLGKMGTKYDLLYTGSKEVQGKPLDVIDLTMQTTMAAGANPLVKIRIKDQKADGKMYFDSAAGRMSHSEIVQDMTMEVTAGGQNIEQQIQQSIKMVLTPAQ